MDFHSLLGLASENQAKKSGRNQFSAKDLKVKPPKKTPKEKKLSENVKRFLEKQKEDEVKQKVDADRKRQNLLTLRKENKKSTRAMNSMLKTGKSANKAAIPEAKNASETSATLAGRFQCDEDDYGYESREANSFYEKLMSKYEQTYEDPMDKFTKSGNKKSSKNLAKTLNKVKGALNGDDQEASVKARGHKRPSEDRSSSQLPAKKSKKAMMEEAAAKRRQVRASKPPPLQFNDLIKMAKQQQKAPPKAEVSKPEKDFEFERPMTKKEKEEFMRERESKLRRMGKLPPKELAKKPEDKVSAKVKDKDSKVKSEEKQEQPVKKKPVFVGPEFHPAVVKAPKPSTSQTSPGRPLPSEGQRPPAKKPSSAKSRPKGRSRSPSPIPQRRSQHSKQNYIGSDEEEDDYDSEMDDFIDDSDARIDISAEIRNIFKYDRRKFRDEDDFDDRAMENNRFSDLMKEEARSAKIGLMEDLEDMRREEEEKKRKKLAKKQRR